MRPGPIEGHVVVLALGAPFSVHPGAPQRGAPIRRACGPAFALPKAGGCTGAAGAILSAFRHAPARRAQALKL